MQSDLEMIFWVKHYRIEITKKLIRRYSKWLTTQMRKDIQMRR